jgi:branched-chain amino acid transport system substrate-binding protein
MNWKARLPLVALVLFAAVGLASLFTYKTQVALGDPNVIKIASSMPRSGSARGQTDSIADGLRLAFHEIDYKLDVTTPTGEKKTYRIEYLDFDDATAAAGDWTIEQEITNANVARNDPDVMVYIGTYNSGAAKVSMPILNKANLLMISPANTTPGLTKPKMGDPHEPACYRPTGNINYIRVVPADDVQADVSVMWTKDLGAKRVYILDDNSLYGKGIADRFNKTAKRRGLEVIAQQSIDPKQQEFKPLMQAIKDKKPDLVYFGGTTQTKGGQLLKDMQSVGLKVPMMAPDGCMEKAFIESAGAETFKEMTFYVTFGGLTVDQLKEHRGPAFIKSYTELYDKEPTEAYAAYGYECGLVALEAIRKAGVKDRDAIRIAGLNTRNFVGTASIWNIDANGDTDSKTMSGSTVVDGKFQFLRKLILQN